jgi:dolichol-phosphate mannosyltransferase
MRLLSVVVPVYRNAESLKELHGRLSAVAEGLAGIACEFVFVDDGSPDDSFAVLEQLAAADRRVAVIGLSRNFGSNAALFAGLQHTRGDAVVTLAADLQDPPEVVPALVDEWTRGSEVVLAARRSRQDPLVTRLFASAFNRLFRLFVFSDFPREGFDFVLLDRKVVDVLVAMPERNSYLFGQVMWVGFRRGSVFYDRASRQHGRSAWTFWRKVKYFLDAFTAFSYLPVRAASLLGFVLAILGFLYAALVFVLRLTGAVSQPQGFAALMIVVLVTAGVQLAVAGLIGEYLWRVLEEVRPRPPFIVARRIDPPKASAPDHRSE